MNALVKQLYNVIEEVSKEVNKNGVSLKPFSPLPHHVKSDIGLQNLAETLRYLQSYLEIISEVGVEIEAPAKKTSLQLNTFLRRHGLKMGDTDFLTELGERDLVEVYSLNHHQLFRNPEFFRISSYDLETLVFVPWHNLFWRHESVQSVIIDILDKVTEEGILAWEQPPVPKHILRECYEEHDRCIHYSMKKVGVILDSESSGVMGYMTILDAFPLDQDSKIAIL